MRFESDGAMATSILPTGGRGIPVSTRFQFVPPSCVMYTPLDGPPLYSCHVRCNSCHAPATSVFGSFASIDSAEQPVSAFTKSDGFHVVPPSVDLNTPRSCCGPVPRPTAHV